MLHLLAYVGGLSTKLEDEPESTKNAVSSCISNVSSQVLVVRCVSVRKNSRIHFIFIHV